MVLFLASQEPRGELSVDVTVVENFHSVGPNFFRWLISPLSIVHRRLSVHRLLVVHFGASHVVQTFEMV